MKKIAFPIEMGLFAVILQGFTILFIFPVLNRLFGVSGYALAGVAFASIMCIIIPIFICYRVIGTFTNRFKNLRTTLFWSLIFLIVTFFICWVRVAIKGYYLPSFSLSYLTAYTIFMDILLLPILEEILDSGYILQLLLENSPKITAILVASFLSTIAHVVIYNNIFSLIFIFIVSITYSLAYLKGGLGTSIISHVIFNMLANTWR